MENISIREKLLELRDEKYREFVFKLVPNVSIENIIGIRAPIMKKFKSNLNKEEKELFIKELPHKYLEENTLHMLLISDIKDFNLAIEELEKFIPEIDNWATCDAIGSKSFLKNPEQTIKILEKWSKDPHPYSQRLVCVILLKYFSKDLFNIRHINFLDNMKSDDYYVKMGKAWYLSYVLIFHYNEILGHFESNYFEKWIHNKSIQKAVESFRVSEERKSYLKSLRIKK